MHKKTEAKIGETNTPPQAGAATISGKSAPTVLIVAGLLLAGRALILPPSRQSPPLLIAIRAVLPLGLSVWGCLLLAGSLRARPSVLRAWASGEARSALLLSWSAAVAAADIYAGAGPLVFVLGVGYASAIGWDRMRRFVILALAGLGVVAAAALVSSMATGAAFNTEYLLVVAASSAAAIAAARTVRSFVAPGREKLRSLEQENRQLWDLSFRDALTGLYNRRFAQETGRKYLSRARRYHEPLHVFMLDIDHFKKVNDQLSHAVGDEVLKGVADAVQACLRSSDSVARYGGEEFLAFVIQTEAEVAQFIANRIREYVATRKFEGVPWPITISIGVASAQDGDDLDTLIDRADKYLYTSKRGGRNKVSGF